MTDTLTICALEMGAIDDGNGDPIGWTVPMSQLREIARACLQAAADNVSEEAVEAGYETLCTAEIELGDDGNEIPWEWTSARSAFKSMITAIAGEKG